MPKTIFALALILAIAGAFVIGFKKELFLSKSFFLNNLKPQEKQNYLFPNLETEKIDSLQFTYQGQEKLFTKSGDTWQEKEATQAAKPQTIKTSLDTLKNLKKDELVSTNPEKQTLFEVDAKALQIVAKSGGQTQAHLYLGKRGQSYSSNFYRAEGDNNVYLSSGALDAILAPIQPQQ